MRRELLSMGYRPLSPRVWGKPVGFHLLTFDTEKMEISNFFKSPRTDETLLYERQKIDEDNFVRQIKSFESYAKYTITSSADWSFLTKEQEIEFLLAEDKR